MIVVSHAHGGLGGGRDGRGGWYECGVVRMSGDGEALPECEEGTLMTPDHTAVQMCSSG